ncbi:unnamed protein product [Sympodiomycopsis kandeliae]
MSSSSSSRKRSDLIERIRYHNPLPQPPYPPKLLQIPTPADRLADPQWSNRLANTVPLPLIVDSEGGIPLDITKFPELWDPALQQHKTPAASEMHPDDAWMLDTKLANGSQPPLFTPGSTLTSTNVTTTANGHDALPTAEDSSQAHAGITAKDVAWLRRTEYIGADRKAKAEAAIKAAAAAKTTTTQQDVSPSAEIKRIEATFKDVTATDLNTLRHPTKKDIRPVDSFALLPDFDTWATEMHVFKFSDNPGHQQQSNTPDARVAISLLRARQDPVTSRPMMSYYLPSTTPPEMTLKEFDELLLADKDAFDAEFFKDQAGQLDDSIRAAAIVRREEIRRQKGFTADLPSAPEDADEDDEQQLEYISARAKATTPYRHQRDYYMEKQGSEEEWSRLLVLNFANNSTSTLPLVTREHSHLTHPPSSSNTSSSIRYHPITARTTLRSKRQTKVQASGQDSDHWSNILLFRSQLTDRQIKKRLKVRSQVQKVDLKQLEQVQSESEAEDEEEEEDAEGEQEEQEQEEQPQQEEDEEQLDSKAEAPEASESESGSEDEDQSGSELDDDELAGLREEAGTPEHDQEEEGEGRRRRRVATAATDGDAMEQAGGQEQEQGQGGQDGMDIDDEE